MEHVTQLSLIEDTKPMIDISNVIAQLEGLDDDAKIEAINAIKLQLHHASPLRGEPVDCVLWVKNETVQANDYNPNSVAPPEMELLEVSILEDGYTQPIVTFSEDDHRTVVDGFHRNRVGKESKLVRERIRGYLPVVTINSDRTGKGDRIAATIRHNRARGKHKIDAMSEIIIDLKRRNWSNEKISRELGMDADEILRLAQITGLAEMFADTQFTEAWEAVDGLVIDETDTLETAE
jgi:ParB-like chromosome segregation protein Spo0J